MKPAFIVDGQTEQRIIQRICCRGTKVLVHNKNGDDVPIEIICKSLATLVRLLIDNFSPIFIFVDRERRTISADDMHSQMVRLLEKEVDVNPIRLVIVDRCIENWILADKAVLGHSIGQTEGIHGKALVKRVLKRQKLTYHELKTGVELFAKIDPAAAANCSQSFAKMKQLLDDRCEWLQRKR